MIMTHTLSRGRRKKTLMEKRIIKVMMKRAVMVETEVTKRRR